MSNGCAATLVATFVAAPTTTLNRSCTREQLSPWATD